MRCSHLSKLFTALLCALHGLAAFAQSVDARSTEQFQRQQQRERAEADRLQRLQPDVRLSVDVPAEPATSVPPEAKGPCFPVHRISLVGNNAGAYSWALKSANPFLNTCVASSDVNAIITAVQNELISAGYVTTRVVVAEQDLNQGDLVLTVVPGRIRKIEVTSPKDKLKYWPGPTYQSALPNAVGDVLNVRDIEQGLENLKRISTADADIKIVPGDEPGESSLDIQWNQERPVHLTFSVDDSGSKSTGKYQASATLALDNPLGLQDLFSLNTSHDVFADGNGSSTRNIATSYSFPIGYWLLSASASKYRYYQSVAGATQNYQYSGESSNADVRVTRVLYRNASRKITASVRGYVRSSRNFIDDTEIEVQHRRMGGFEYAITDKEFIGDAVLEGTLSYKRGTGAFGTLAAPEEEFGEGTSRPKIISTNIDLSIPITIGTQRLQYQGNWRGQWNRTPLITQDQFSIGGRYTVRGFDGESSLLAERGQLLRNDIAWSLTSFFQPYIALDYGRVGGPSSARLIGKELAGAAVGARGSLGGWQYDVFIGQPIYKPTGFPTANTAGGFSLMYAL